MRLPTALCLAALLAPAACAGQAPTAAPVYHDWRMVANADVIVRARLTVPVAEVRWKRQASGRIMARWRSGGGSARSPYDSPAFDAVAVCADVIEVLKGSARMRPLVFRYDADPRYDGRNPSGDRLCSLSGRAAIVCLQTPADEVSPPYYPADSIRAIQADTPAVRDMIRREIANQSLIVRAYPPSVDARPDAQHVRVKALIDSTTRAATQCKAFAEIEKMGRPAVPSIIRLMDDRRLLAFPSISLRNNFKGAFEADRIYGPRRVVDALHALLEQITGESFGEIHNGRTELDRRKAIDGWRVYLHYKLVRH